MTTIQSTLQPNLPFEGDRQVFVRGIPDEARVISARVEVVTAPGQDEFVIDQDISVVANASTFGATESQGSGSGNTRWVEVDFHARRTLASVRGSNLQAATLQIDLGGAYVEINQNGALLAPGGTSFSLADVNGDGVFDLPGLTVTKFKLTRNTPPILQPDISVVTVRSAPTNLSFRIGNQAPFWTILGELTESQSSPDFSELLQAFLADADSENGFYSVPITIHSDTLAKLQVRLVVEFSSEQSVLPPGLNEVQVAFDSSGVPAGAAPTLNIPAGVPINVRSLSGRIIGRFGETRIAAGSRGMVGDTKSEPLVKESDLRVRVPEETSLSPAFAQLVGIQPNCSEQVESSAIRKISATAIDVLVAVNEPCRLKLDLRHDADGKPSDDSVLPQPIAFNVEPQADGRADWASVPLQRGLILGGERPDSGKPQQYWLVLQSVAQDSFDWHAEESKSDKPSLQRTLDGGLSWRAVDNLCALYRIRHEPDTFTMPIELQVGSGASAGCLSLARFAPLGRVDVSLDFQELVDTVNLSIKNGLEQREHPVCPQVEHLVNGDFERWLPGSTAVEPTGVSVQPRLVGSPEEWTLVSGVVRPYVIESPFTVIAVLADDENNSVISQVAPVQESCTVELSFVGLASSPGAVMEVRWLSADCEAIGDAERIDIATMTPVVVELADTLKLLSTFNRGLSLRYHRLRTNVPGGAAQAEVQFVVPRNSVAAIAAVSLMGTTESLANADLKQLDESDRPVDWQVEPASAKVEFSFESQSNKLTLTNNELPAELVQTISAPTEQAFELQFRGRSNSIAGGAGMRVELVWLDSNQKPLGKATVLNAEANGFDTLAAKGVTPKDTAQGTVRLLLPPRVVAEIESVSIRFTSINAVPLTIVSQAPGEVTLLDLRAEFEPGEFTAPSIPEQGLCLPTDSRAGADDCGCCCPKCDGKLKDLKPHRTRANRPALVGQCRDCPTDAEPVVIFGGKLDANAPLLTAHRLQPATLSITVSPTRTGASLGELAVASIKGIGDKSAKKLAELKVKTIADLANLPSETDVSGISRFSSIRETARELTNLNLDAKSFAPGQPVTLADLAKSSVKKLSASSGHTVDEAKQLLESVRFIEDHIDVGDFRNLTLNKDNTIRRRGI